MAEDSEIYCDDVESEPDERVDWEIQLVDSNGRGIAYKYIKFYLDDEFDVELECDEDGYAEAYIRAPENEGDYELKAVFRGDGDYEECECTATLWVEEEEEEEEINISLQGGTPSVELIVPVFLTLNVSLQGGTPEVELEVEEEEEEEEEEINISLQGGILTVQLTIILPPPPAIANEIVLQNQAALVEAFSSRTAEFKIEGWTKPPFICIVCGQSFNTEEDYITHMTKHLTAYDEGNL